MMYAIGFWLGRLIGAYLVVWIAAWALNRFNYKASVRWLHSKKGLLTVVGVFVFFAILHVATLSRGVSA